METDLDGNSNTDDTKTDIISPIYSEESSIENPLGQSPNPRPVSSEPEISSQCIFQYPTYLIIGAFVFVVLAYFFFRNETASNVIPAKDLELEIKKYIKGWINNYPNQNHDTWSNAAGHLEEFVSGSSPAPLIFVLAYKEAVRTTELLASDLARAALELKFGNDTCGESNLFKLHGNDYRIKKGFLLNEHAVHIKDCRKMIMYNLQDLNPSAAKDLHPLLDQDYPSIGNVVYIFTVQVSNDSNRNVYHDVCSTIKKHWSPFMEDDRLHPLFSRLINNLKITPEPIFEL